MDAGDVTAREVILFSAYIHVLSIGRALLSWALRAREGPFGPVRELLRLLSTHVCFDQEINSKLKILPGYEIL